MANITITINSPPPLNINEPAPVELLVGGTISFDTAPTDYYEHLQSVASASWTVNHGIGQLRGVQVMDLAGNVVDAEVQHPSVNQTLILLTAPFAGRAIFT